ncbi:hypothetical protein D3C72_839340 [compost metagenome]
MKAGTRFDHWVSTMPGRLPCLPMVVIKPVAPAKAVLTAAKSVKQALRTSRYSKGWPPSTMARPDRNALSYCLICASLNKTRHSIEVSGLVALTRITMVV